MAVSIANVKMKLVVLIKLNKMNKDSIEFLGDNHIATNIATPLMANAFKKSDEKKIANIQVHFQKIMEELGLDITDDSLSGTPYRVAKMYVKELFMVLILRINLNFQLLIIHMDTKKC